MASRSADAAHRPARSLLAGIEAGGTKTVVAVGTGPDDLRGPHRFPTTDPRTTLERATSSVAELAAGDRLAAVGMAAFGPVDLRHASPTYGRITSTPKRGWRDTDVVGPIGRALGVPVGLDTDVNAAALGEARWGATRDLHTSVYVTVGTGIGGGALIGGRPLHGRMHPEMGHLVVRRHPEDAYPGRCPFHGDCLEGLASGPAIEERWGRPAERLGDDLSGAVAIEASYLAQLVLAVTYVLSPQRIVLGGGVMRTGGLLPAVRAVTTELLGGYLEVPAATGGAASYLVAPSLGARAGVLGAIVLAGRARQHAQRTPGDDHPRREEPPAAEER